MGRKGNVVKALVTGGGGFLGGAIVEQLVARGDDVRSFSRQNYDSLQVLNVEQVNGDLANIEDVKCAVEGVDIVFHVAAKAGAWGDYDSFFRTNVLGTKNILEACRAKRVRYLVYTSSPSVVFDGTDMEGVDESLPYPDHHEAAYPATKALAEKAVREANGEDLFTISLRPHLIWGPKDNHLITRIVSRGKKGKLKKIGHENKLIDTVYVDDAARSHLLAADRLMSDSKTAADLGGNVYFISSGKPIETWEMVNQILAAAGLPPVRKTVSPKMAYAAGSILETTYRLLRIQNEPMMTRWVARELSTAHWFNISAAKRDLGYEPQISLEEGMARVSTWLKESDHAIA